LDFPIFLIRDFLQKALKILDYKLEIALVCVVISIAVALGFHLYSKRKQKASKDTHENI